ncbi:uncharacterized protein LOC120254702 [Dioscorea cayenensis subsp. rotundata]|uniref:Uncharacterized protein LOC120254702 n=1 Tax=Dioscorea cayennensis subsp. rotundata TaxID=55577 RepID=A0AB40AUU1_DIOCR|nr:uncharacterized protein LOC120254702 [Dioscorea cayenensis subsp. rotundata]
MNYAKIICWNCRGISARDTSARVFRFIKKFKPQVVCLIETRANLERLDRFCKKVPNQWGWAVILADGYSGGIIVLWNTVIGQVTPLAFSRHALHLVVSSALSKTFLISVIYNSLRWRSQLFLWNELSKITPLVIPWLILGDFNTVLSRNEHRGRNFSYYLRKSRYFSDFINNNNLLDLKFIGSPYTWCNNQIGPARRWSRLDRCLVNIEWNDMFKSYTLKHLQRSFSDHFPLFLTANLFSKHSKRLFKFENFWLEFLGCFEAVREAFNFTPHGNPMHAFSHLLLRTHNRLKSWSINGVNDVESAIIHTENLIQNLECSDADIGSHQVLMELYAKLSALQQQCSIKWAQQARLLWVKDGDKNTKVLHAIARTRSHTNFIPQIEDLNGNKHCTPEDVEKAFLNYYQQLWKAPSSPNINFDEALPSDLPSLTPMDCEYLIREITMEEVYAALLDLPSVIDTSGVNQWVWYPKPTCSKISICFTIDSINKDLPPIVGLCFDGPFIFTNAISRLEIQVRTIGFFISNANYKVILARRLSQPLNDNSSDAILAIELPLRTTLQLKSR